MLLIRDFEIVVVVFDNIFSSSSLMIRLISVINVATDFLFKFSIFTINGVLLGLKDTAL